MQFFLEVLIGGLLAGVMYSMVAIGFVLIFKASGVFNFAQGAFVLFAALTYVSLVERHVPAFGALFITLSAMIGLGMLVERCVLRRLTNRSPLTLFMATLGLSYMLEGASQMLWGAQVHGLELGISDQPIEIGKVLVSQFDLFAAGTAAVLVGGLGLLVSRTRFGVALRAVADDPVAALSIGINLPRVWSLVWAVSGVVALVAGLLWGARVGVQFSLSLVVLKALPVLIIGGFTSVAGTIIAGLLVGASEKLAEVYVGTLLNGGIEAWFPYVLALV
ncbi:MAG TPA: branched-chain amino acid ABC transporter permease, partial [Polyangiaceae bacterium]|nr:branched-chain amino acid ABC transporter permease [Polyangiaceae bacterium]